VVARLTAGQAVEWGAVLSWREFFSSLAFVARVGLTAITPLLAGLFLGRWMDDWLEIGPWVTLILTVVGAVAGLVGAWRLSSTFLKRMMRGNREENL
jgi:F0F1-type ATP synthase assembly protein I